MTKIHETTDFTTIKMLLGYIWPKGDRKARVRASFAIISLVISKILLVCVPLIYKHAVDILTHDINTIPIAILLAYGTVRFFSVAFTELKDLCFAYVEGKAMRQAAIDTFKHLHNLSLQFHLSRKTGGVSRTIELGVKAIERILRFSMFNIIPTIFEILFVAITLWVMYTPEFCIITMFTVSCYVFYTIKVTQWRAQYVRAMNKSDTSANSKAIDSLLNFETVKYFTNEEFEYERYDTSLASYQDAMIKNKQGLSILNIGQGLIIALGLTLIMLLAGQHVKSGTMTIGDFVLVNTFLLQLYAPLNILGFAYREIKMALVDMEQMFSLLSTEPTIKDKANAKKLKVDKGKIEFIDVEFDYTGKRKILKGISFLVNPGETIAIVGSSGAGKSTIARTLYRFYELDSGCIKIDDQDIKKVSQKSLRQAIGIVPQDTVLFNESIEYNIGYANPSASKSEIHQAAKHAKIHDFIMALPDQYDTIVGERGLKLSGGEKQRIAIARTILKKPKIFVFDEATSSLDSQTEREIQKSLLEISREHSTLIIAHRLSTIVNSDKIIVLEHGEIAESGTHRSLLAKGGKYAKMWKIQHKKKKSTQIFKEV